eukprot:scaffold179_cov368-Prasinococcus_capsulatus_cf.AAC.47
MDLRVEGLGMPLWRHGAIFGHRVGFPRIGKHGAVWVWDVGGEARKRSDPGAERAARRRAGRLAHGARTSRTHACTYISPPPHTRQTRGKACGALSRESTWRVRPCVQPARNTLALSQQPGPCGTTAAECFHRCASKYPVSRNVQRRTLARKPARGLFDRATQPKPSSSGASHDPLLHQGPMKPQGLIICGYKQIRLR